MKSSIEYPSLKEAADAASRSSQRSFLILSIAQLVVLVVSAFISGCIPASPFAQQQLTITIVVLMVVALAINTILRVAKCDDRWFRCRALAENIKSAVWYFVMSPADTSSETAYLSQVGQLQSLLEQVMKEVAIHDTGGPLVTNWMKEAQQLPLDQKLSLYRKRRLEDQREWYLRKSQSHAKSEKRWFAAIFVSEFTAIGYAAFQACWLWKFNVVGAIAATSAGLIAWTQTKRFSDLALSYGIAAGDLRRIAAESEHAATEADAKLLVQEVEIAVSREHSLWLSRRVC